MRLIVFFVLMAGCLSFTRAQVNVSDSSIRTLSIFASFSYQFPGNDLSELYRNNMTIGGGLRYKSISNWVIEAEGNFIFGSTPKNVDTLMWMLKTRDGFVISGDGVPARLSFYQRGLHVSAKLGKIIPVLSPNPNSGLLLMVGMGYSYTRIRIEVQDNNTPQLADDYAKGYDRMRGGFTLTQFLGYQLMGNSRILNFYAGIEWVQAFSKSLRDYQFDMIGADEGSYLDTYFGIKIGWMIPFYGRAPKDYYYY